MAKGLCILNASHDRIDYLESVSSLARELMAKVLCILNTSSFRVFINKVVKIFS